MSNVVIAGTPPSGDTALPVALSVDRVNDYLPIYTASAGATQAITPNTLLGITGAPVGTTDSQTLSAKTLTSPTINGATLSGTLSGTYTLGGTPTFPSTVVLTTATQTLTNKTLTSPTINAPTITNASITTDAITGYTTSNTGTVYGISVTAGTIGSAALATNAVTTSAITDGAVTATKLSSSAITLGYAAATSGLTSMAATPTLIPGCSVTVTVPTGGRYVKVTGFVSNISASVATAANLFIYNAATVTGSSIQTSSLYMSTSGTSNSVMIQWVGLLTAGVTSFCLAADVTTGGAGTLTVSSAAPTYILVEAI